MYTTVERLRTERVIIVVVRSLSTHVYNKREKALKRPLQELHNAASPVGAAHT